MVTGQLLQMLSNTQRPRTAASSTGVDKTKKGPLPWKFHDISVKGVTGSGTGKPKTEPISDVLQGETGVSTANVKQECASDDDVTCDTAADTFCPKITSIVSLEKMQ